MQKIITNCKILSVKARDFHTDLKEIGGYECSDKKINELHNAVLRSTLTNFVHIPTDCPHREKNGWTADAYLSSYQALLNFDMKYSYIKWLDDIVDCQRPNGAIPCIAPTSIWGYGWGSGVTWDAALFIIPWNMYLLYGDKSLLSRYYKPMEKYLEYLKTTAEDNIFMIGLGDWVAPAEAIPFDNRVILTCMAKKVIEIFAEVSNILGENGNSKTATKWACDIKKAFNKKLIKNQAPSQTYYASLIYFDMCNDKEKCALDLIECIKKANWHISAGIFGAFIVPLALRETGHFDIAWKIVCQKDYPSWFYLMDKCSGTLGENWSGASSRNHHMFSPVDAFISSSLSGLNLSEKNIAFKDIKLKPYFPDDIDYFKYHINTVDGKIIIDWDKSIYNVHLPDGIKGELILKGKTYSLTSGKNSFELS